MLCEYCGKNQSMIRVKAILDGKTVEYGLCAECARKLGYGDLLFIAEAGYGVLSRFSSGGDEDSEALRCSCCGASFRDILRSGRVGCAECYRTFSDQLEPLIRRIHGSVTHRGKSAGGGDLPQVVPKAQLSVMHRRLREAIERENFEQAAVLRDQIHKMEEDGQ